MPSDHRRTRVEFPSKVVGWLNVWDVDKYEEERHSPRPTWEPYFCILRQDLKTFMCHFSEYTTDEIPGLRPLPVYRIDDGKRQFDRRWGYEALESIKENALQHLSSERLFKSNKLRDTSFNESMPELNRLNCSTSDLYPPKKKHVFRKFFPYGPSSVSLFRSSSNSQYKGDHSSMHVQPAAS